MIISHLFLLKMRNGVDTRKSYSEGQNTHFYRKTFFSDNHSFYEIMWRNKLQPGRPQVTIQYGAGALQAGQIKL